MIEDQKLTIKMYRLLGKLECISYPLIWSDKSEVNNQAYYDLLDSIVEQYKDILKSTLGYEDD